MNLRHLASELRKRWVWIPLALLPALPFAAAFAPEPERLYAGVAVGTVVAVLGFAVANLREAATEARVLSLRPSTRPAAKPRFSEPIADRKLKAFARWTGRLENGWSATAAPLLMKTATTKNEDPRYRLKVLRALCGWAVRSRGERFERRDLDLDVVIVSNMNLPGGTTSSNEAEILAFREAGLKVGLLHHPVWNGNIARQINPKLEVLIDGDRVVRLTAADSARCKLMIVRLPNTMVKLMDDLPRIEPERTILVINQTPHEEYGVTGGYGRAWNIADVHRNLTDWVGDHTWYGISPVVLDILDRHHADELVGIDVSPEPWYNTIDMRRWELDADRPEPAGWNEPAEWNESAGTVDRPFRIGRHSRDHLTKWLNAAAQLRAAYPLREDIEVHVMGGHKSVRRILGSLPANWVSHPFGSMTAPEFLREIDAYVYFPDEAYVEAFGRAPLEAMTAGVPCILPEVFAPLFGDGALYCRPEEVEREVRRLMDDPAYYASRVAAGHRVVRERFSPQALMRRLASFGIEADPSVFDAPIAPEHAPCGLDDITTQRTFA